MQWNLDLGIAAGLAVLLWVVFYFAFPSEPLSAAETAFVLAVFYVLVKLARWGISRWRGGAKAEAQRK